MIIFNKHIKQENKKLNNVLNKARNEQDIITALEVFYERISNRPEKDFDKYYSLIKIMESKTIKVLKRIFDKQNGDGVVLEIVKYITAPNKYLIIYNEFKEFIPTKLEIYKEREV